MISVALASSVVCAQYDYNLDNQTNTINTVQNWPGDYIVGSNTFGNALIINSSGVLSNNSDYLGYEAGGSNNIAIVNAGIWTNRGYLVVGVNGANNQLIVTNGGRVFCSNIQGSPGCLGLLSSSSNNLVLVTGAGSVWNDLGELHVGEEGLGNRLEVTDGGRVLNTLGYLGYKSSSSNNTVMVTGIGSVWSNSSSLYVGYRGAGNQLTIADGARSLSKYLCWVVSEVGEAGDAGKRNA